MQRSIVVVTSLGIVMASASLAPGCVFGDADCAQLSACPPLGGPGGGGGEGGGGETLEPDCVPSDNNANEIPESCGVFVSWSGKDTNDGTPIAPVRTLAEAIKRAGKDGKMMPIYACADEVFTEKVIAPAGTTLYGGLKRNAAVWTYGGGANKTIIVSPVDEMAMSQIALVLSGGGGTTHIENVWVIAPNAAMPGGSSIAALVNGVHAELVGCELAAGDGKVGAKGETPSASIGPSDPTNSMIQGGDGIAGCMGSMSIPGGTGTMNPMCTNAVGGAGGKGDLTYGGTGQNGAPSNPDGKGIGGIGDKGDGMGCHSGLDGQIGMDGSSGAGASSSEGALSSSGFIGAAGEPGMEASPGQGGGGGGGARGPTSQMCNGASGAGGGAGGCGGKGGLGGQGGGASIALASVNATVMLKDVGLSSSNGGNGGEGGNGQAGGIGGFGGEGGPGGGGVIGACNGGVGGNGGIGGKGGGGHGGPSVGVAYTGPAPVMEGVSITTGIPGQGGAGAADGGAGADGVTSDGVTSGVLKL